MSRRRRFPRAALACRTTLVAVVMSLPGWLAGGMVGLLTGGFGTCTVVGAMTGAVLGGLLEAWSPAERDEA